MITEAGLLAVVRNHAHRDLTQRMLAVMITLRDGQPWKTRDLADAINGDKPLISRVMTTLEALGYVKRWRGTEDKRDSFSVITPAGKRYLAALAGEKGRRAA